MPAITTKSEKAPKASKGDKVTTVTHLLGKGYDDFDTLPAKYQDLLRLPDSLAIKFSLMGDDCVLRNWQWVPIPGSVNPGITTTIDLTSASGLELIRSIYGEKGPEESEADQHQRPLDKANVREMGESQADGGWRHNHETVILMVSCAQVTDGTE